MNAPYVIVSARYRDLAHLPEIELAAARLLVGFAPEAVLGATTPIAEFVEALSRGHLWVARAADRPVGFAHVKVVEAGSAHLDELDVHPDHGRRGLGRSLVGAVCEWATRTEVRAVTLTTFREPRWNMPFYASLGFEEVPRAACSPAMKRIIVDETRRGLDPSRRVVMRRLLATRSPAA